MKITEKQLRSIIKKVIKESIDERMALGGEDKTYMKISSLVQQANDAFHKAQEMDSTKHCLMKRNGDIYGLDGDIKLSKNGRIIIPLTSPYGTEYPINAKVFSCAGGRCVPYKDYMDDDWTSCTRILKQIIQDAERCVNHLQNYDPSWEEGSDDDIANLKQFNRDNGFNVNTGVSDIKYNRQFR